MNNHLRGRFYAARTMEDFYLCQRLYMKKTIGKTFLIICICALLIFLLLPFLETQETAGGQGKKAVPQIFTSNPLTELVNRLASLFKKKNKHPAQNAALAEKVANKDALSELYADVPAEVAARYAIESEEGGKTQTSLLQATNFDYGNAAMQDKDGNWVLVRQTAPQANAKGIYEINTTDDAYDRYVRQERASRFTPGLDAPSRPADSALARLLTPIKNLLGKKQSNPVETIQREPTAQPVATSQGLGGNQDKTPSPDIIRNTFSPADLPSGSTPRMTRRAPAGGASASTAGNVYSGGDLFNPMLAITRASDWIANHQDEEASDEEKQNNQQKLANIISQTKAELSNKLTRQVREDAGSTPASDRLPTTIGCKGESGSFYVGGTASCDTIPSITQDPNAWMSAEEQDKQNQQGKQKLVEKLNLPAGHPALPDVNLLVVLGKTKNVHPPDMENNTTDTPEQKQAKEAISRIYELMLEKQNCANEECYWIPNQLQQYPSVRETVISAGFNSVEDPLGLYSQWVPELEQKLAEETQDDDSGERFITMKEALSKNAPAYIPVTRAQMQELNRRNDDRKLLNPQTRKDHIIFYVADPQNARDMSDVFQEHPAFLVWGKDGSVFDRSANLNTAARADILQNDLTERAKDMAVFAQGVIQELYRENIIDTSRRKAQKISTMNASQATQALQQNLPDTQKKPSGNKITNSKIPGLQFEEYKP